MQGYESGFNSCSVHQPYQKAAGIVLLSILLYQILVYYNCKNRYNQRPKSIKHMLCS
jgi:hypothetical protein